MPVRTIYYSFSTGLVSEEFARRADVARQRAALLSSENFIIKTTGAAVGRPGTLLVSQAPQHEVRLTDFTFSQDQSYILEFTANRVRIFRDITGPIMVGGAAVVVSTPYAAADLARLSFSQTADVLIIRHPDHPPAEFFRVSETDWRYRVITFRPAPVLELETVLGGTLTLSATTGTITITTDGPPFLQADVGRTVIVFAGGEASITDVPTPEGAQTVSGFVLVPFEATTFAGGDWALTASPQATLTVSDTQPRGKIVALSLSLPPEDLASLLPEFAAWTDYSGPLISTGTHNGTTQTTQLIDSTKDFVADGVQLGHLVYNDTQSTGPSTVTGFATTTNPNDTVTYTPNQQFQNGHSYRIIGTGQATTTADAMRLSGGAQGVAWLEAPMATTAGEQYSLTFRVREADVSLRIGSTAQQDDIHPEATYAINVIGEEHTVTFFATTGTTYVAFRNNQNTTSTVDQVKAVPINAFGWRTMDVGRYVQVNDGTIQLTEYTNAFTMQGVIEEPLDFSTPALAGAWALADPVWSATRGYPQAGAFHQGRLAYGGSRSNPLALVLSAVGEPNNFAVGANPSDALIYILSGEQMNTIQWIYSFHDLVVGTQGSEHQVTSVNASLTPEDRVQIPLSNEGMASLEPLRIANSIFALQYGTRDILEMQFSDEGGLLDIVNMMVTNEDITIGGVKDWVYQRQPTQTLWIVRGDGAVVGLTVNMVEEIRAWHLHRYSGRVVSIARQALGAQALPETERLWVAVTDGSATWIEVHRPKQEGATSVVEALTVDRAILYRGEATTVLTGLEALNGKTVAAVERTPVTTNGVTREKLAYLGTFTVTNGQITLPYPAENVDVGLPFVPTMEPVPPDVPTQDGTLQGRWHRWSRMALRLKDAVGVTVNGVRVPVRVPDDTMDEGHVPKSSLVDVDIPGWKQEAHVVVTQPLPLPVTVLNLIGDLEWETVP